jgi:hypothetical protein
MIIDAFTVGGAIVALVVVVATVLSTGCCRKRG